MPGTFSKSNRPARPGPYTNFLAQELVGINAPLNGVVAIPFTADWGPLDEVQDIDSWEQYKQIFGSSDTPGSRAVFQAFKGEGVYNRGGAVQVKALRIGGSAAAKATRTSKNTAVENALVVTALYAGAFGSTLTTQDVVNAADANYHDFIIGDANGELERFKYAKTNITALGAAINASSDWVTATVSKSGVALATDGSAVALSGGNDGSTLEASDWSAARDVLETTRFGVFVPYALTDETLLAAFKTWVVEQNEAGKRFTAVFPATDETVEQALQDADTLASEHCVVTGGYIVTDEDIVNATTGELRELKPSDFAPRIAGIVAARGERSSITFGRLGGVSVVSGPTDAETVDCLEGGVVTIGQDSVQVATVRIEKGVTTYQSDTTTKPFAIYSSIKFLRTMCGIEMDLTEYAEANVIGQLPVNDDSREDLVTACRAIIKARADNQIVQDGFTVSVDNDPPPTPQDDFIQIRYGIAFERATEQTFNTIYVG